MKFGFVGLGRMGLNMVTRLLNSGEHELVVYNRSTPAIEEAVKLGATGSESIEELVGKLGAPEIPKTVWLMIPSGAPVDDKIKELRNVLEIGLEPDMGITKIDDPTMIHELENIAWM